MVVRLDFLLRFYCSPPCIFVLFCFVLLLLFLFLFLFLVFFFFIYPAYGVRVTIDDLKVEATFSPASISFAFYFVVADQSIHSSNAPF
jgi:hypothetical protein